MQLSKVSFHKTNRKDKSLVESVNREDMNRSRMRANDEDAQAQNIPRVELRLSRVIEEKARPCSLLPDRFTVTRYSPRSRSIEIHYCPQTGCNAICRIHFNVKFSIEKKKKKIMQKYCDFYISCNLNF